MNSANVIGAVLFYRLIGELGRLSMHSPVCSMYSIPIQKELMYPTTYHMTAMLSIGMSSISLRSLMPRLHPLMRKRVC